MRKFVTLRRLGLLAVAGSTLAMTVAVGAGNASATTPKATRPCTTKDVAFYQSHAGPDGKEYAGSSLFVKAKAGKSCSLKGHLSRVTFRNAAGKSLGLDVTKSTKYPEKKVSVGKGREAEIDLHWKSHGSSAGVVTPTRLTFRLPGAKHDSAVAWHNGPISVNTPITHTAAFPAGN